MAKANFPDPCLTFTLKHEGGLVDDPDDPGGLTNQGITLATFSAYFPRVGDAAGLRAMTVEQRNIIYDAGYWIVTGCDKLPSGVDLVVFDFAVNAGPKRSVIALETAAGTKRDGIDGPLTETAIGKMDPVVVITKLTNLHEAFYRADSDFDEFGGGWLARLADCRTQALAMAEAANAPSAQKTS
jgi:lysozyme family protein